MFDSGENFSPEPSVNKYRFQLEKDRRLQKGEKIDILLSQETSFVNDGLVIANLKLLRSEGTFLPEERNWDEVEDVGYRNFTISENFNLEKTDWEKISQKASEFILSEPKILAELNISNLDDLDPAVATTLAFEITKKYLSYDDKLTDYRATEEADEILEKGSGTCEHFTKVSVAIYEYFKSINKSKSLRNTTLIAVGNSLLDDLPEHHSYCLLIAKRGETVLSIGDPTFYREMDYEVQSDIRLASLAESLVSERMIDKLNIKKDTVLGFINEQLGRIENRINFSNIEESDKQDERIAHLFTEANSLLQIVYALNTAKSLLEDEKSYFVSSHYHEGAVATFKFLDAHRDQLGEMKHLFGIKKLLEIDRGGGIDLALLNDICIILTKNQIEKDSGIKIFLTNEVKTVLNKLSKETVLVNSVTEDNPWGDIKKEPKYKTSEIESVRVLIEQISQPLPINHY